MNYYNFWGKSANDKEPYPLYAHIIDVASVAELLLRNSIKKFFTSFFSPKLEEEKIINNICFLAGLHDIGKATPQFQSKNTSHKILLEKLGMDFTNTPEYKSHALDSALILSAWDKHKNKIETIMTEISKYLAMHHGTIFKKNSLRKNIKKIGGKQWQEQQFGLIDELQKTYQAESIIDLEVMEPAFYLIFTGLVTYCDWIASIDKYFYCSQPSSDFEKYRYDSLEKAKIALKETGLSHTSSLVSLEFTEYFKNINIKKPRNLQQEIIDLALGEKPSLTIIEAPTGEGKTEAAFYLAARQQSIQSNRGIYVAMPTMATSNAIYGRLLSFLKEAHNAEKGSANIMLVHSHSFLNDTMNKLIENYRNREKDNDDNISAQAPEWFLPSKRSLLAPYGAGTVDQTFLSVLNVKHFFLRLFGLAGKTVIFDEVHAYDTYMAEIHIQLLKWLKAMNSNVIILSATLPANIKKRFLQAWDCESNNPGEIYPLVSHAAGNNLIEHTFQTREIKDCQKDMKGNYIKSININILKRNSRDDEIILKLTEEAQKGCDTAYIVNTVGRCQCIYEEIEKSQKKNGGNYELHIFHSRYTFGDRKRIEENVLKRFGKDKNGKTSGAIIIATQVIEQSLDLDFDVMFTDLAPIDLLIQRAGRLWRHDNAERPKDCTNPVLHIVMPEEDENGLPKTKKLSSIYEEIIIYRTYLLLKDCEKWCFPEDYRKLVEGVYDFEREIEGLSDEQYDIFEEKLNDFINGTRKSKFIAEENIIYLPEYLDEMFEDEDKQMPEDNYKHPYYKIKTRLGEPSITMILIFKTGNERFIRVKTELINIKNAGLHDFVFSSVSVPLSFLDCNIQEISPEYWKEYQESNKFLKKYAALELLSNNNKEFKFQYNEITGFVNNRKDTND